jgi:hypothetical protein
MRIAARRAAEPDISGRTAVANDGTAGPKKVKKPIVSPKTVVATPNCSPLRKTWMTVLQNTFPTGV